MSDNIPENIPEQIPEPIPDAAPSSSDLAVLQDQSETSEQIAPAAVATYEQERRSSSARSVFIAIAGWFVPGLGHLVQRRIGRAMAGLAAVGTMAVIGLWMRGNVFPMHSDDAFGLLGFIADAGSGIFYLFAHMIEKSGPDVSRAAGDYGTRLIATAGVLNILFVLDALEISRGHKN
jgi:drug/metabolite transporter (DMT)-like permease